MKELAETLLPDLPKELWWVYGVFYIIEGITFFSMLLCPFYLMFTSRKRK